MLFQLAFPQNGDGKLGGEELLQGLLDGGDIAGDDGIPLEIGGGIEDKPVFLQGHGLSIVKPGGEGGGGQIGFHQLQDVGPEFRRGIHISLLTHFSL